MEIVLAIMFVDVCDSTRLYEAIGDVRAVEIIQAELRRLEAVIATHSGRVVKRLGDGLMCTFQTAGQAVQAATDMMPSVADTGLQIAQSRKLSVRIGVHHGSVVDSDGDVFGDAVNVAARIENLASPNEVLLTNEVVTRLPDDMRYRCQLVDATVVKGKSVPVTLFRMHQFTSPEDSVDSTVLINSAIGRLRAIKRVLTLTYQKNKIVVDADKPKVMIGRAETCDIIIMSRQASRLHGSIELARETFILTEHSSNGTFIRTGNEPTLPIRRNSAQLTGSGLIGFGAVPVYDEEDHVVSFRCVVSP
ncbi:MAG: adenylate/guanylate cyclase domain-containing protein [Rhodospirillaceae bacterium]